MVQRKYTLEGHGIPHVSEWDLHVAATSYYSACATRENIHPGTWHSSMYIRMGSQTVPASYYQQLVHKGEITLPRDSGVPPCISEWDLRCCDYYQQLVPQGEIPRDMAFLHVYIRMGSTRVPYTTSSLCHKGETWDVAFLHVYQNGIYGATSYSSHKEGRITPRTWHSSCIYQNGIYTVQRCYYHQLVATRISWGYGIPQCI
jgi:hypothetical protein